MSDERVKPLMCVSKHLHDVLFVELAPGAVLVIVGLVEEHAVECEV